MRADHEKKSASLPDGERQRTPSVRGHTVDSRVSEVGAPVPAEKAPSVGERMAWCSICSGWTVWVGPRGDGLFICGSCDVGFFVPLWQVEA